MEKMENGRLRGMESLDGTRWVELLISMDKCGAFAVEVRRRIESITNGLIGSIPKEDVASCYSDDDCFISLTERKILLVVKELEKINCAVNELQRT